MQADEKTFFGKVSMIIRQPDEFFAYVKDDRSISGPWVFYVKLMGLCSLITFVTSILATLVHQSIFSMLGIPNPAVQQLSLLSGMFGFASSIPFMILISFLMKLLYFITAIFIIFVIAAVYHLLLLIVGAKNGYVETFKAVTYSSAPFLIAGLATILSIIPFIGGLAASLVSLGVFIYFIVLMVKGARILHGITTARAAVAIVVIPVCLWLILALILVVMFAAVLFASIGSLGLTGNAISRLLP